MLKFHTTSGIVVSTAVLGYRPLPPPSLSDAPPAKAATQIASVLHQPLAKADRLPVRTLGAGLFDRRLALLRSGLSFRSQNFLPMRRERYASLLFASAFSWHRLVAMPPYVSI